MSRVRLYSVALAGVVLVVPFVARAAEAPIHRYQAAISPLAVEPSSSTTYSVALTSHPQSTNASEAHIQIPAGFSVDNIPTATTTCSVIPWVALVISGSIDLTSTPEAELCPGGTLTVTFLATAPAPEGSYTWITALSGSGGQFDLQGSDPTVTVDSTPPPPPSIQSSTPNSPANNNAPILNGTAEAISTVRVYTDSACAPPVAGTGTAVLGQFHIPVSVGDNTTTTFYATATDLASNASLCSQGFTYVEDSAAPAKPAILTSTPSSPANNNAPTLNGTAEASSTVNIYKDPACTAVVAGTATADGSGDFHIPATVGDNTTTTFYATATDLASNTSLCSEGFTYIEDSIHPLVTLTDKPAALTNQTIASFNFSSNKPSSTYECKLDAGGFAGCTSPRLYTGLADGSHTFSVRATSLGNIGPATEYTWTVDTVAPETAVTSTPPASSSSASASFAFTSSEAGSTFACSLDAGGLAPCASPKTYGGLGDSAHTFRVEAVDAAGNADATPASYSWQIAGVGPGTTDTRPPGNVKRLKRIVGYGRLKLSWSRPSDSDFDHVEVFVSTSAKSLPRTPVYSGRAGKYTNKRFRNGFYYRFAVVSYDHAGNASRGAGAVVPPSILLRSPRDGRRVNAPPLLLWAGVPKATFFNVQLYHGSQKILSRWPKAAKLKLSRSWRFEGRRFQLKKGSYHWYVWPAFGSRSKARYGQLLGQSTFGIR